MSFLITIFNSVFQGLSEKLDFAAVIRKCKFYDIYTIVLFPFIDH